MLLKEVGLRSSVLTVFLRAVFSLQRLRARKQGVRVGSWGPCRFFRFSVPRFKSRLTLRWTPRFREIFAKAGMSLDDPANFATIDAFYAHEEWAKLRRPSALEAAQARLTALADWMKGRDSRGSLHRWGPAQMPVLETYRLRCEVRPAFQKALAARLAPFAKNAPAGKSP